MSMVENHCTALLREKRKKNEKKEEIETKHSLSY